jgi:hypothetical protein
MPAYGRRSTELPDHRARHIGFIALRPAVLIGLYMAV